MYKKYEEDFAFITSEMYPKLLCKGICYALLFARSRLCLACKISTPAGSILQPNLAAICITPFVST